MIIGLHALKRCGKDTVANYIVKNYGFTKYALADPLRKYLLGSIQTSSTCPMFIRNFTMDHFLGNGYDRETPLPLSNRDVFYVLRSAMYSCLRDRNVLDGYKYEQCVVDVTLHNTEAWSVRRLMQCFGTDLMCNNVDQQIWNKFALDFIAEHGKVVLSDIRQPWEAKFVHSMDGAMFHIRNDRVKATDKHSTEQGLPVECEDFVLLNNSTLEELYAQIDMIMQSLKEDKND